MAVHEFPHSRSIPQLFTDVVTQLTDLMQKELRLARVEISENLSSMATGVGLIVGGAVLLIPALVILLQAAVQGLETTGLAAYWSALIVGGAAFLIGLILLLVGMGRLKAKNLVPNKTMEQLRQDASMANEHLRPADRTRSEHAPHRAA